MFNSQVTVRFGDVDQAGVVYYPRVLHYFHCAWEDFFEALGKPYRRMLEEDRFGFPIVRVECDYHKPLQLGDRLDIEVSIARLGNKSVTAQFVGHVTGEKAAAATITSVCIGQGFRSQPIPDTYRKLFQSHLE